MASPEFQNWLPGIGKLFLLDIPPISSFIINFAYNETSEKILSDRYLTWLFAKVLTHKNQRGKEDTMRATDIPEITKLSTPEKILLLEELWDSIAADEPFVPVPQSHTKELSRRLKSYESAPGNLLSLDELQTRIEKKK